MTQHHVRARRAEQPRRYDIFAAGLDPDSVQEFAAAREGAKAGAQPSEREIDILCKLINAIPEDADGVRRVPEE